MRIAILGCGSIGRRHMRNLITLGCTDLLPYDPAPATAEIIEKEFALSCCRELDEVWSRRPEVAFVTCPTSGHLSLALEAARRGCDLFIEKPLSHSLENVDLLSSEVNRRQRIVMVGCNMRVHPGPAAIKRCLYERVVGEVLASRIQSGSYLPDWRPGTDYHQSYSASAAQGGGAILDCIHEIDLALWYFGPGDVVGAASLQAGNIGLAVEGLAEILIRHDCGVITNVHLNFVQRDYRRSCQVIGSDGTIYWDFQEPEVKYYHSTNGWNVRRQPAEWALNQMYVDEVAYFLSCVRRRDQTVNGLDSALATLRVALCAKNLALRLETNASSPIPASPSGRPVRENENRSPETSHFT